MARCYSRNESGTVGQCFGTVSNSLSNSSFVSISAASGSVPPAPLGTAGIHLPHLGPPHTHGSIITYREEVWTLLFLKPGNNLTTLLTYNWVSCQCISFPTMVELPCLLSTSQWWTVLWLCALMHASLSFKQVAVNSSCTRL